MATEYTPNEETKPARSAIAITPNDSADLASTCRALLLDADGTVTVDMLHTGTNIALPLVKGFNPVIVTRVYATGTDGGLTIVGLY